MMMEEIGSQCERRVTGQRERRKNRQGAAEHVRREDEMTMKRPLAANRLIIREGGHVPPLLGPSPWIALHIVG
jgi:hypothetical protein